MKLILFLKIIKYDCSYFASPCVRNGTNNSHLHNRCYIWLFLMVIYVIYLFPIGGLNPLIPVALFEALYIYLLLGTPLSLILDLLRLKTKKTNKKCKERKASYLVKPVLVLQASRGSWPEGWTSPLGPDPPCTTTNTTTYNSGYVLI